MILIYNNLHDLNRNKMISEKKWYRSSLIKLYENNTAGVGGRRERLHPIPNVN